MAGDEDRPAPDGAKDIPSPLGDDAAAPLPPNDNAAAIAAQEPSMVSAGADLAASDRPAESFASAPPVPPSAAERRSSMPTVLSVIGIVLILLLAANLYTLYNPPGDAALPALQAEVAQLRQQIAAVPKVDLAPLDRRVTALAGDIEPLKAAVASTAGADAVAADVKNAIGPLESRVGDLDQRVAALPKVDLAPVDAKLSDLDKRVGTLGEAMAANSQKLAPVDERLAALDKRLLPVEAYFNAPKSTDQVTEARQNGSAAETRAAPLAVIAQAILAALPAGRPFPAEAKALGTLGVDGATLQPLQAVADTGAATDAALLSGFAGVQDSMVIAAAPVETGTMFDRMMANAQSLVKVSRTGAGSGSDAGAVASRIQADLKSGALKAALHEWDALPDASKARAADWAARLKARVAAEDAARAVQDKAVAALVATP